MRKKQILSTGICSTGKYFTLATIWKHSRALGLYAYTGYMGFNGNGGETTNGSCALFQGYMYARINSHSAYYEIQNAIAMKNPNYAQKKLVQ